MTFHIAQNLDYADSSVIRTTQQPFRSGSARDVSDLTAAEPGKGGNDHIQ